MSYTEMHTGVLSEKEVLNDLDGYLNFHNINPVNTYNIGNYTCYYNDDNTKLIIITPSKRIFFVKDREHDDIEGVSYLHSTVNGFTYVLSFYNGSTCFSECLIELLKKNNIN